MRACQPLSAGVAACGFFVFLTLRTRRGKLLLLFEYGVPGGIRTHGPRIRNPVLYPAELRRLINDLARTYLNFYTPKFSPGIHMVFKNG